MGNWTFVVNGVGAHHNTDNPTDADRLFAGFIDKLRAAGCQVSTAVMITGNDKLQAEASGYNTTAPYVRFGAVDGLQGFRRDGVTTGDPAAVSADVSCPLTGDEPPAPTLGSPPAYQPDPA